MGRYAAIAFGAPGFDPPEEPNIFERMLTAAKTAEVEIAWDYECEKPYLGIVLGDSNMVTGTDLGHLIGGCVSIRRLADALDTHPAKAKAHLAWDRFRRAAAEGGIDIPEGTVFLLADYD